MTQEEIFKTAKADFAKLKNLLTTRGILSLTNRDDFVSKVWALPIIDPKYYPEQDLIDFEFSSISATLFWQKDKTSPELSTIVDIWVEESDGYNFYTTLDIEEI